ncbi:MAG: hypothetical protein IKP64_09300 [Selenomonadaceae bacterium]|nr:hypothetical protein [Selenomonadaceae bacterium]MBR4383739.1 hypothetical protein [Selenomonadaceae bacterium]
MFENITKEFIRTHEFQADCAPVEYPAQSFRLNPNQNLPPSPDEMQNDLRKVFAEIMATTFKKNYALMDNRCSISEAAMRKYLNGSRPINFFAVAKFCIGAKLSVEKLYELAKLCGHIVSPEIYLLDAIVVGALKCGDTIDVFYDETIEFGLQEIWKRDKRL